MCIYLYIKITDKSKQYQNIPKYINEGNCKIDIKYINEGN